MAFLRTKTVRGEQYAYLVRSVWDPERGSSRQEIIKYLGRASDVSEADIPEQYRGDKKIAAFVEAKDRFGGQKGADERFGRDLLEALRASDLQRALGVYSEYRDLFGMVEFFERVLAPSMQRIGDMWRRGSLGIGVEHVCSNTAHALVGAIRRDVRARPKRRTVLVCTPAGEEHNIGCGVLEACLASSGYDVLNMSPSAPAESVLEAVRDKEPDAVMVSVTLDENARACQRLVARITAESDVPVIVGGQAAAESVFGDAAYGGTLGGLARAVARRLRDA